MSSKFSNITTTQSPPKVCRKGPPADVVPRPPFDEWFFQGYAEWYDELASDNVQLAGNLQMIPDPPNKTWQGTTPGSPYALQVDMERFPLTGLWDFTITLLLNGFPSGAYQQTDVDPRSIDPFDSGLINFTQSGGQIRIHCRIMS